MEQKKPNKAATITKIDTIDDKYSLISGYRNGHFYAAAYDGPHLIKSMISDDLNAVPDYKRFRQSVIEELKTNK